MTSRAAARPRGADDDDDEEKKKKKAKSHAMLQQSTHGFYTCRLPPLHDDDPSRMEIYPRVAFLALARSHVAFGAPGIKIQTSRLA